MGNINSTEVPTSSTDPTPRSVGDMIQNLQEEIICSICLSPFSDPVSIDCGHNFCQSCLSNHWKDVLGSDYRCPECRHLCNPIRMKPDTRMKNLVEKIGELPLLEEANKELNMATASMVSGQPVQLMGLDENGNLCLNEAVLSFCLEQKQVKDVPVCLVAILGEQRRGKSFLLNFLLRRLQNLSAQDDSWLGQEDEPLAGFEWQPGINSTTKGVWIWNQPFWVPSKDGKVALFLVDTEGSMDIQRSKEVSVKLSAFSILFSSYQILNVSHMLKDTDLEYLDMFVYVAQTVGCACKLKPIQRLDVLVRDWLFSHNYGFEGGQPHLRDVIQKLEDQPNRYSQALQTLKSANCHCFLMPFPGKKLVMGNEGTIAGMDEDFRNCLRDYGNYIARSSWKHIKRNQDGTPLTGAELAVRIKNFSDCMKQHRFGFSSPTQMAITLQNLEIQETFLKKFKEFIDEQDQQTRPLFASLKVKPSLMTQRFLQKQQELLQQCTESLQGDEPTRTNSLLRLKSHLQSEARGFLERYTRHFKTQALYVGLAVGGGALGLAGGAIGAGVAAALLAAEAIVLSTGTAATFAIGTAAGAGTLALVGGGVGAGVGKSIAKAQEAKNMANDDSEAEEDEENLSDEKNLIG